MLEVKDLSYKYGKSFVIDGISFNVGKGEIVGILGPNGCGKSTTLKNLNKNLKPMGGCVLLEDTDIAEMTKRNIAQKIAVVPQTNEINFSFTVREIVAMGRTPFQGSLSGETREDTKIIDDAIRQTGLTELVDRHINTMSGGERQRVIIARAIAQTPKIILMDEPTLHLDISMQFEVLDLIKELSERNNLTVVIVSHDLPMVARYCDRMILLHNSKIYAQGTPDEVLTKENMRVVFDIDAEPEKDPRTGKTTVRLYGSCKEKSQ